MPRFFRRLREGVFDEDDLHELADDDFVQHLRAIHDGVAGVLHGKGGVVPAPEHLGINTARQALAEGVEDRTVLVGVVRAVGMRMVGDLVHVAPQQRSRRMADHARAGTVDEHAAAVEVDAVMTRERCRRFVGVEFCLPRPARVAQQQGEVCIGIGEPPQVLRRSYVG